MSSDRSAAIALLAGSAAGLVVMALHPTGGDVVRESSAGGSNALVSAVHAVALLAQPLLLAGLLALTLALRARRDLAVGAYVCFALASVALVVAAAASGFLAPAVVRGLAGADEPARAAAMGALRFTGQLNHAFATIYVMFAAAAILLWSVAMLASRELSRALAVYGLLLGAALLAGLASGRLHLDVHGFGLVVLGQGIWMVWVAARLWRGPAARQAPSGAAMSPRS